MTRKPKGKGGLRAAEGKGGDNSGRGKHVELAGGKNFRHIHVPHKFALSTYCVSCPVLDAGDTG